MSNVGYSTLTIIPSAKGFGPALSKETSPAMATGGKEGGGLFGKGLIGALGPVAAAVGGLFAAQKVVGFFSGAIREASDLNESVNALQVVYGQNADGIMKLGQGAAKAMGLSNVEFNGLAVRFSSFSKTIAGDGGDVTKTLQSITGRASDFASVMNLEVSDAAQLFQSGLAGESEPLRAYGIDLSAATVNAYAYAHGIGTAGKELTEAQKVQARYGSLMEQTAQTQGDFANTSDQLANSQRILGASWDNITAKIGVAFLPILGKLVGFMATSVLPAIEGMLPVFGKIGDGVKLFWAAFTGADTKVDLGAWTAPIVDFASKVRAVFDSIATAAAPFVATFTSALSSLGPSLLGVLPMLSPFGLVLQALLPVLPTIGALVAALASQFATFLGPALAMVVPLVGTIVQALSGVFVALMPTIVALVAALSDAFSKLAPVVLGVVGAIVPLVSTLISSLAPIIVDLVGSVLPPLISIFSSVVDAIAPLITQIASFLIPIIEALLPVVQTVFQYVADLIGAAMKIIQGVIQVVTGIISGNWSQVWTGVGNIFSGIWDAIVGVATYATNIVKSIIGVAGAVISSVWSAIWSGIASFFSNIWDGIVTVVGLYITAVRTVINTVLGVIRGIWEGGWEGIASFLGGIWANVVGAVSAGIGNVVRFLTSLPGQALAALASLPTLLVSVGRNMIEGLIDGVKSVAGKIGDAVLGPIKDSVNAVKNFLGIHSPSRLFMEIGGYTGEGMALGLEKSGKLVAKASEALIPTAPTFRSPQVAVGFADAATAALGRGGDHFETKYYDYSTSHEDKAAKLQRAQTALEQSVAARRGR